MKTTDCIESFLEGLAAMDILVSLAQKKISAACPHSDCNKEFVIDGRDIVNDKWVENNRIWRRKVCPACGKFYHWKVILESVSENEAGKQNYKFGFQTFHRVINR